MQYSGQYSGQYHGQHNGQHNGQYIRQYSVQDHGQYNGQYSGQYMGLLAGTSLDPHPAHPLACQVMDPVKASYGVDNALYAVGQLAQTTMRSELGTGGGDHAQ